MIKTVIIKPEVYDVSQFDYMVLNVCASSHYHVYTSHPSPPLSLPITSPGLFWTLSSQVRGQLSPNTHGTLELALRLGQKSIAYNIEYYFMPCLTCQPLTGLGTNSNLTHMRLRGKVWPLQVHTCKQDTCVSFWYHLNSFYFILLCLFLSPSRFWVIFWE